jgi:hypothetical protein
MKNMCKEVVKKFSICWKIVILINHQIMFNKTVKKTLKSILWVLLLPFIIGVWIVTQCVWH